MKVTPLKEDDFIVSKSKVFKSLKGNENAEGIKMAIQPFLVSLKDDHILMDAGIGWQEDGKIKLLENLSQNGLSPNAITKVLTSHLHKDHVNGLVSSAGEELQLTLPQAKLYIQRREYEFAISQKQSLSYDQEKLAFLVSRAKIEWLDKDEGEINPEIRYLVTGGHSPYHQVFWISTEDRTVFYGADNLPQPGYLKFHIAYKTDYDGKKAMQWRTEWEAMAKAAHWEILFYHDMKKPIIQF